MAICTECSRWTGQGGDIGLGICPTCKAEIQAESEAKGPMPVQPGAREMFARLVDEVAERHGLTQPAAAL